MTSLPTRTSVLRAIVLIGYPVSRIATLAHRHAGTDVLIYYNWLLEVFHGHTPYRDFRVEYPPGAWLLIRALASSDWLTYLDRFRMVSAAVELAGFACFLSIVSRHRRDQFWLLSAAYVLCTAVLEHMLYDHLDAVLLGVLLFWAWLRMVPDRSRARMARVGSYFVLGFAVAFKVMPIVLLPSTVLVDVRLRGIRESSVSAVAFLAGLILPFAILWPSAGSAPVFFYQAHLTRGLEFETVWATLLWFARPLGLPLSVYSQNHIIQVLGPWTGAMTRVAAVAPAVVALLLVAWQLRRQNVTQAFAAAVASFTLVAAVGTSIVLSPQFFLWFCPLLILASAEVLDERALPRYLAVVFAAALLTGLYWPTLFRELREVQTMAWTLLAARNIAFVTACLWLWRAMRRGTPAR